MKTSVWIAVALSILVTVFMFPYSATLFHTTRDTTAVPLGVKTYGKDAYGISFSYPSAYVLSEGMRGTILDERFEILLIHQSDVQIPTGGEGPRAITVELYERLATGESLAAWLKRVPHSNYALGNGLLTPMRVDGREALQYEWDGLYRGRTTAFLHDSYVVLMTVTYDSPEDMIVGDYRAVLSSLHLSN